jgi:hypothetical protein
MIYSLAIGNETWRCDSTDIVNYLAGRESIMDAIMAQYAQQRRTSNIAVLNPRLRTPVPAVRAPL